MSLDFLFVGSLVGAVLTQLGWGLNHHWNRSPQMLFLLQQDGTELSIDSIDAFMVLFFENFDHF